MSKILTLKDRIAMEKCEVDEEEKILVDALPSIFEKLIRSPEATWLHDYKLNSVIVQLEDHEYRIKNLKRQGEIVKFLNEQLALEKYKYLEYPKIQFCSFGSHGDYRRLIVYFVANRFSHMD